MADIEKLVWPMLLNDVKVLVEGVADNGEIYRIRSAGYLDVAQPEELAIVEVTPVHEPSDKRVGPPSRSYLLIAGEMMPDPDADGAVYIVELLQERELLSFHAKYRSECRDCDEGIHPGQVIDLDDDRSPYHVVCPDDVGMDNKPRPVCPRCFLVLLPNGACGYCEPED